MAHLALKEDLGPSGDIIVERNENVLEVIDGPLLKRLAQNGEERPHLGRDTRRVVSQVAHLGGHNPSRGAVLGRGRWCIV
jgi:hypothetical protein